jgi:hypothetical protein
VHALVAAPAEVPLATYPSLQTPFWKYCKRQDAIVAKGCLASCRQGLNAAKSLSPVRFRSRLRQGPKRRFVDPSLAVAAIDEASETLRRFADRIDTKKCGDPSLLAVITGNGFGYVRPDGVAVIPIGSLGP